MTPREFALKMARQWKRSGRPFAELAKHRDPEVQKLVEAEYNRFTPRRSKAK